mmetsp:Transcript_65451/g.96895  ORF Transcript_65451/g.96895 Transcript_65451/m.96895 type:complete len:224 (-) Transcript_65451:1307-1978(-)
MNEKRKKDDESSSATELSSSMAAPSNHKTADAAATSTSEYDRINSLFLSVEENKDEVEEKKATPEKSKNSKKKRGKVEEDYCLPPSSHSSSEEEGVTNRSSSSEEFYESFPRAPRTPIPEPERSCCSHGMTFAIGLFILLHFACCLVSWFVPWWDGDLHVTLSKEDANTRDWEFWKDAHVVRLFVFLYITNIYNILSLSYVTGYSPFERQRCSFSQRHSHSTS